MYDSDITDNEVSIRRERIIAATKIVKAFTKEQLKGHTIEGTLQTLYDAAVKYLTKELS